jgi:hypothetical protein
MTSAENSVPTRTSTFRGRIVWVSVWILAASEQLARLGSVGLAAALGWEVTKRTRWLLKKRLQQNATNRHIARTETDAAAQSASLSEIGGLESGYSRTDPKSGLVVGPRHEAARRQVRPPCQGSHETAHLDSHDPR